MIFVSLIQHFVLFFAWWIKRLMRSNVWFDFGFRFIFHFDFEQQLTVKFEFLHTFICKFLLCFLLPLSLSLFLYALVYSSSCLIRIHKFIYVQFAFYFCCKLKNFRFTQAFLLDIYFNPVFVLLFSLLFYLQFVPQFVCVCTL